MVFAVRCEAGEHLNVAIASALGERYAFLHAGTEDVAVNNSNARTTTIPCKYDMVRK